MYQNNFKYITVLFAFLKVKDTNSCLKQHQKHFLMGTRASKFQSSEELSGKTEVKFHHQFHFTSTFKCFIYYFKIYFLHLVLLEMISFENIFKRVAQKFPIISVKSFSPLVTRTFRGFLLNT